jgi:acyl carrier protein
MAKLAPSWTDRLTKLDVESQIAGFIMDTFLLTPEEVGPDTSFLETELLDSTGILNLVLFVESTFDVTVDGTDITPDNFDSISRLTDYVRRKQTSPTAS